jgi:serine/threonine protein kinase
MSGVCKISDFGISKRTDDSSGGASTAMQGTVFWMAPEVINTQKKGYNFKIDIWSVGCVVLEMWAGMRPWMGHEAFAVMFKVLPISFQMWKLLTLTRYASFTSLNSLLQCQKTSSCPN